MGDARRLLLARENFWGEFNATGEFKLQAQRAGAVPKDEELPILSAGDATCRFFIPGRTAVPRPGSQSAFCHEIRVRYRRIA